MNNKEKGISSNMNNSKENKINNIVLPIFALVSVLITIFMILAYTKDVYHSDCAGFLLWAKDIVRTSQLYPKTFHFTTAIFHPFVIFFMLIGQLFSNNDFIIHEWGEIGNLLVIIISSFILFWEDKKKAFFFCILLCNPYCWIYEDMMFYQSAYTFSAFSIILYLIGIKFYINSYDKLTKKKKIIFIFIYSAIFVGMNFCGMSNFIYTVIPGCLTGLLILILEGKTRPTEWIKSRKFTGLILSSVLLTFVSLICFKLLSKRVNYQNIVTNSGLCNGADIPKNLLTVIGNLFQLSGVMGTTNLLSIRSFVSCMAVFFTVIVYVCIPVYMLHRIMLIDDIYTKYICLFTQVSSFLILFVEICSSTLEVRYSIPVSINDFILAAFFVFQDINENEKTNTTLKKYFIFCCSIFWIMSTGVYLGATSKANYQVSFSQLINPHVSNEFLDTLKKNNLTYGYASFWNSYNNMARTNSEITFLAYDAGKPTVPYFFNNNNAQNPNYYAVDEDIYNPDNYKGECFVVVQDGENINNKYYELAKKTVKVENLNILIFEKNIKYYDELVQADLNS